MTLLSVVASCECRFLCGGVIALTLPECRSRLEAIHSSLSQLVDSPESLPLWNATLVVTRALFNFGEFCRDRDPGDSVGEVHRPSGRLWQHFGRNLHPNLFVTERFRATLGPHLPSPPSEPPTLISGVLCDPGFWLVAVLNNSQ